MMYQHHKEVCYLVFDFFLDNNSFTINFDVWITTLYSFQSFPLNLPQIAPNSQVKNLLFFEYI